MELQLLIACLSATIAGLAAIASIQGSRKSLNCANQANEYAQKANRHAKDANIMQAKEWTDQYFHNVKLWADEACDCIAIAIHLDELKDENEIRKKCMDVRSQLSSIIDRGRWYFPNKLHEEYGLEKPIAYRGKRQLILNSLYFAYDTIKKYDVSDPKFKQELFEAQRFFVSEMQKVLNPRKRKDEIEIISDNFKIIDELIKGKDDLYTEKYKFEK